jgi:hypothetical protein
LAKVQCWEIDFFVGSKTINMPNLRPATYTVSIEVAKSPHDVFNHVIDLSKWWPEDYEGESLKLNAEFVLKTGDSHYSKNKVIEFLPDKMVTWLTVASKRKSDGFDWSGTKMVFELIPKDSGTLLNFTYQGVVWENEYDRLVQICDLTIKEIFFNFLVHGSGK